MGFCLHNNAAVAALAAQAAGARKVLIVDWVISLFILFLDELPDSAEGNIEWGMGYAIKELTVFMIMTGCSSWQWHTGDI